MNYFIKIDGEKKGPLSAEEIRQRIAARALNLSDLVRQEDSAEWGSLTSIRQFRDEADALPPSRNPLGAVSLVLALTVIFVPLTTEAAPWPWALPVVLVAWLASLVCGHAALWRIRNAEGSMRGSGLARTALVISYFLLLYALVIGLIPPRSRIAAKGNITKGISNCRQIITTLKLYAEDNQGKYPHAALPDAKNSNTLFRLMFVGGQADNEMIFGCPMSKDGNPDGNIGTTPDYREAVQANENHWAMTKGLTDESDGRIPLIYENPQDATWPPKWNPSLVGTGKPGRTWSGGKVIIGFNDSSVFLMPLESVGGEHVGLKPLEEGKPVFPDLHPKPEVLAPEVK